MPSEFTTKSCMTVTRKVSGLVHWQFLVNRGPESSSSFLRDAIAHDDAMEIRSKQQRLAALFSTLMRLKEAMRRLIIQETPIGSRQLGRMRFSKCWMANNGRPHYCR